LASIYQYFATYEIGIQGKISKQIVFRAIQDNIFPAWLTKQYAEVLFEDGANQINVM